MKRINLESVETRYYDHRPSYSNYLSTLHFADHDEEEVPSPFGRQERLHEGRPQDPAEGQRPDRRRGLRRRHRLRLPKEASHRVIIGTRN